MAGSNGTGADVESQTPPILPFIAVSDAEARVLSRVVTFVFTAYLIIGLLALLKWFARALV